MCGLLGQWRFDPAVVGRRRLGVMAATALPAAKWPPAIFAGRDHGLGAALDAQRLQDADTGSLDRCFRHGSSYWRSAC